MHTAEQLHLEQFDLEVDGQRTSPTEFLDWSGRDRLGVIVDRPYGALGASLAIQMATAAFFAFADGYRRKRRLYADNYLFHVGGPWGNFSSFDFWPERREVFLPAAAAAVLAAINDRGITHLLVPDGPPRPATFPYKEVEASEDRLKLCLAYGANGEASDADVGITTHDPRPLENIAGTLAQERLLGISPRASMRDVSGYVDDIERFRSRVASRLQEAPETARAVAQTRLDAAIAAKRLRETYRRCSVAWAMERITGDAA